MAFRLPMFLLQDLNLQVNSRKRTSHFLMLSVFLVDGRDSDTEPVKVYDAEAVLIETNGEEGCRRFEGITTLMTEHNLTVFLDGEEKQGIGTKVCVTILGMEQEVRLKGIITGIKESRNRTESTQTIEILDDCGNGDEYREVLYDRIPTLPQTLNHDLGLFRYLWRNTVLRLSRGEQE